MIGCVKGGTEATKQKDRVSKLLDQVTGEVRGADVVGSIGGRAAAVKHGYGMQ